MVDIAVAPYVGIIRILEFELDIYITSVAEKKMKSLGKWAIRSNGIHGGLLYPLKLLSSKSLVHFDVALNLSAARFVGQTGHAVQKHAKKIFVQTEFVGIRIVYLMLVLEIHPI